MKINRTEITRELTKRIWNSTYLLGTYRCPEVTINSERVDLLTYTKKDNIWKFYEVKSSKEDFYSKSKWTFLGHFNYFVMTESLYHEVKDDIPDFVGVTNGKRSLKRAKRQELKIDHDFLYFCFMRSLSTQLNSSIDTIDKLRKENYNLEKRIDRLEGKSK